MRSGQVAITKGGASTVERDTHEGLVAVAELKPAEEVAATQFVFSAEFQERSRRSRHLGWPARSSLRHQARAQRVAETRAPRPAGAGVGACLPESIELNATRISWICVYRTVPRLSYSPSQTLQPVRAIPRPAGFGTWPSRSPTSTRPLKISEGRASSWNQSGSTNTRESGSRSSPIPTGCRWSFMKRKGEFGERSIARICGKRAEPVRPLRCLPAGVGFV